jgi:small subunit ribosomal protein S27e
LILMVKSKYLKVKCGECGNEQNVFGNAATVVKCLMCDKVLAEPTGSRAKIYGKILKVL